MIPIEVSKMAKVAKKILYVIALFLPHYDKCIQILTEIGVIQISKVILNYFHSRVAKLCTTEHKSC